MRFVHGLVHLYLLSLVLRPAMVAIVAKAFIDYNLSMFVEVDAIDRAH